MKYYRIDYRDRYGIGFAFKWGRGEAAAIAHLKKSQKERFEVISVKEEK